MYLIAILCPPLAVLLCGKLVQFVINVVLSLLLYIPGMLHALLVVAECKAEERQRKMVRMMQSASA